MQLRHRRADLGTPDRMENPRHQEEVFERSTPMIFVIPKLLAAVAATPRWRVFANVILEAVMRPKATPADRAPKGTISDRHPSSFLRQLG